MLDNLHIGLILLVVLLTIFAVIFVWAFSSTLGELRKIRRNNEEIKIENEQHRCNKSPPEIECRRTKAELAKEQQRCRDCLRDIGMPDCNFMFSSI